MAQSRVPLTTDERNAVETVVAGDRAAARQRPHARLLWRAATSHEVAEREDQSVRAWGRRLRRVDRRRTRWVPEGRDQARPPRPQPPRPDTSPRQGESAPPVVGLAGSAPPPGRGPWPFQRLADARVGWGRGEPRRTEPGRQAVKKLPGSRGSWPRGGARRRPRLPASGAWPRACTRLRGPMSRGLPGSVATQPGSHGGGRGGRRNGPSPARPRGGTTRMHGQGAVSSGGGGSPGVAGGLGPAWRTRRDDARCGRALGAEAYPQAQPMRVVQAMRHTHEGARL